MFLKHNTFSLRPKKKQTGGALGVPVSKDYFERYGME